jgi:hypothetical protein
LGTDIYIAVGALVHWKQAPKNIIVKTLVQWKHLKKLQQTFGPRGTTESGSVKTFVQRESLKLLSKNQPYL